MNSPIFCHSITDRSAGKPRFPRASRFRNVIPRVFTLYLTFTIPCNFPIHFFLDLTTVRESTIKFDESFSGQVVVRIVVRKNRRWSRVTFSQSRWYETSTRVEVASNGQTRGLARKKNVAPHVLFPFARRIPFSSVAFSSRGGFLVPLNEATKQRRFRARKKPRKSESWLPRGTRFRTAGYP